MKCKIIMFLVFRIIATSQNILCSKGSKINQGSAIYFSPVQMGNNKINETKQQFIKQIDNLTIKIECDSDLVYNKFSKDEVVIQVYKGKNTYKLFIFAIILEIMDEQILSQNASIINQIELQILGCKRINDVYLLKNYTYIICEDDELYLFYLFQWTGVEFINTLLQSSTVQELRKNNNCQFVTKANTFNEKLYVSLLNCLEWRVFKLTENSIELIFKPEQFEFKQLKNIQAFLSLFLIFDNEIFEAENTNEPQITLMFETKNFTLHQFYLTSLNFHIKVIQVSSQKSQVFFEDGYLFIEMKDSPIEFYFFKNSIIGLFSESIYQIFDQDLRTIYHIKFKELLISDKYYPYFFGAQDLEIQLLKASPITSYIDCDNYQDGQHLILKNKNIGLQFTTIIDINYEIKFFDFSMQYFNDFQWIDELKHIYIKEESQKFQIIYEFDSVIPRIYIQDYEDLKCQSIEKFKMDQCLLNIEQLIIWKKYFLLKNRFLLIYHTEKYKLYVKDCQNNFIKYLVYLQAEDYYNFNNNVFFVHSKQQKILAFNLDLYPEIKMKDLYFKKSIINIQNIQKNFIILFEDCSIILIDPQFSKMPFVQDNISYKPIHCDRLTLKFNNFFLKVNAYTITVFTKYLTFHASFQQQDQEFIQILPIGNNQNTFIIVSQKDNQFVLSKYFISDDFAIIKNFDFPQYHYQFSYPLKYQFNNQYLIVTAFQSNISQSSQVFLIYEIENEKYTILIDVIEIIENMDFDLIVGNILILYSQQKLYKHYIGKVIINCQLKNQLIDYVKRTKYPIFFQSKIFQNQTIEKYIQLEIWNSIQNLKLLHHNPILLLRSQQQLFDPRKYIFGPIEGIKSDDIVIVTPFQLIKTIMNPDCQYIVKNFCITKSNTRIINILDQSEFLQINDSQQILAENDLLIVKQSQGDSIQLVFFNQKNFNKMFEIQIFDINSIFYVKVVHSYVFIFQSFRMHLYSIKDNQFILLQSFNISCNQCNLFEILSNRPTYLIYHPTIFNNQIYYLTMNDSDSKFIDFKLNIIVTNDNDDFKFKFSQFFINSELETKNKVTQKKLKIFAFDFQFLFYIFQANLDLNKKVFNIETQLGLVKIWGSNSFLLSYLFISENIFLCKRQDEVYLYNVSEIENVKYFNPIFSIQLINYFIEPINQTHILISSQNRIDYEIMKIGGSYILQNISELFDYKKLTIYNNVSQLEIQLNFFERNEPNMLDKIWKELASVIFIFVLSTLLFYYCINRKNNKKIHVNELSQNEIEL